MVASALRTVRHQLVWLHDAGWQAAIAAAPADHQAALSDWQARKAPLVVRRHEPGARNDELCLGLPLPPDPVSGNKLRIALKVKRQQIEGIKPALPLHLALAVEAPWRTTLIALQQAGQSLNLQVYGSLAMQAMTGLPYLTASSDIDLLYHPQRVTQLQQALALLGEYAGRLPLDGEIVFPGDQAVAWKEWRQALAHPAKVLVKSSHAVHLCEPAALLATLEQT
jgi:phosphoribosyl-dephospho-CoA transferase